VIGLDSTAQLQHNRKRGIALMTKEMMVQINDCRLFAKLVGNKTGKPTIVMDAGYGDYSKAWDKVIDELSGMSNVLIYDRAGLGKSEPTNAPRTSREMVKELNQLLKEAKVKPPYILVGHSFGGVNARLYATEFQREVCGIVLIDSTPENYRERFLPTMSEEFQRLYNKQFVHEGNYDEFMESLKQIKDSKTKLSIPLIVLSAGQKAHYSKASQELWNVMQSELLDLSADAEFIIAENSAHYIQNDQPEVVIDAVRRLIDLC
jgi:pimeloyl-ACP methyl ester carboxylesterase